LQLAVGRKQWQLAAAVGSLQKAAAVDSGSWQIADSR